MIYRSHSLLQLRQTLLNPRKFSTSILKLNRNFTDDVSRVINDSGTVSKSNSPILVLGLESSADDTCASVVSSDKRILSNVVIKQSTTHEQFGGIHPMYAVENHMKNMGVAIRDALKLAGVTLNDLSAVSYTRGPGMFGCLAVCGGAAKAIAGATGLPLISVHHMQAHALTPFLTEEIPPEFPFLTLLLSGGHTLLLLAESESKFKILATTTDESIGVSLDKVCRDLKVPWSLGKGSPGAALETFASFDLSSPSTTYSHPKLMLPYRNQLSFSFSGLRSAFGRILAKEEGGVDEMKEDRKRELVRAFFGTCFGQVEEKVGLGLKYFESQQLEKDSVELSKLGGLVVSGGVASNSWLRVRLRAKLDSLGYKDLRLIFPPPELCTDNAAMIAWVGINRFKKGLIDPIDTMQISKWSLEDLDKFN